MLLLIMTIFGLTTILEKNCTNFQPFQLHDTKLVVNGPDFAGFVYESLSNAYAGENLAYYLKLRKIVTAFKKCNIEAYFIFPGSKQHCGDHVNTKLLKLQKQIDRMLEESATDFTVPNQSVPLVGSSSTLQEVLKVEGMYYLITPYSIVRSSAALAALLDCPVATTTSDYFMLTDRAELNEHTNAFRSLAILPLRMLQTEPIECAKKSDMYARYFLSCHIYRVASSEIAAIAPKHRPVLALLCGTDTMPLCKLPPDVCKNLHCANDKHPKENRFRCLVSWLRTFGPDSMKPVEDFVNNYQIPYRQEVINRLVELIPTLIYDPAIDCKPLLRLLPFPESVLSSYPSSIEIPGDTPMQAKPPLFQSVKNQCFSLCDVFNLLQGSRLPDLTETDYTTTWSPRLVQSFRNGSIHHSFISPLFSGSCYFGLRLENLGYDNPVYHVTQALRQLHYRAVLRLESDLGWPNRMAGRSDWSVIEYMRLGGKVVAYHLHNEPLGVDYAHALTDDILTTVFHLPPNQQVTKPAWLFALAVTLNLCHRAFEGQPQNLNAIPLDQCSLWLAVAALAVISVNEMLSADADVLAHYDQLALQYAKQLVPGKPTKPETQNAIPERPQRPDLIYQYDAIQLTYFTLGSFVHLLESLLPAENGSQLFHFLPCWVVFPSGSLIYWMTLHLETKHASSRRHLAMRYWIPRLYRRKDQIPASACATELKLLIRTLDALLQLACSLKVDLPSVQCNRISKVKLPSQPSSRPHCNSFNRNQFPVRTIEQHNNMHKHGPSFRTPDLSYARRLRDRLSQRESLNTPTKT